jgi:hypothetical protein
LRGVVRKPVHPPNLIQRFRFTIGIRRRLSRSLMPVGRRRSFEVKMASANAAAIVSSSEASSSDRGRSDAAISTTLALSS